VCVDSFFPGLAPSHFTVYVAVHNPSPAVRKLSTHLPFDDISSFVSPFDPGLVYAEFLISLLVLFTRAYTVWGATRHTIYFLSLIYAGGIAGTSYSIFLYLRGVSPHAIGIQNGRLFQIVNDDLWIALAILVFCESFALGMLLIRYVQYAREMNMFNYSISRRSILKVMAKDGLGYFACTLVITATNLEVHKRVTADLRDFLFVTQGAVQCVLCSRLLFHIHIANEFPNGTHTSEGAPLPSIEVVPRSLARRGGIRGGPTENL